MLKKELAVGEQYRMKVSGTVQDVRLDSIEESSDYKGRLRTTFRCTNLRTGRSCVAHSASKFRGKVGLAAAKINRIGLDAVAAEILANRERKEKHERLVAGRTEAELAKVTLPL